MPENRIELLRDSRGDRVVHVWVRDHRTGEWNAIHPDDLRWEVESADRSEPLRRRIALWLALRRRARGTRWGERLLHFGHRQ